MTGLVKAQCGLIAFTAGERACCSTLWQFTIPSPLRRLATTYALREPVGKPPKDKQKPTKRMRDATYALSRVVPALSGLPMVVYVSPATGPHDPRIQVSQRYGDRMVMGDWFSMTVEDEPRIVGKPGSIKVRDLVVVQDWLLLNRQVILDYWEQRTTDTLVMLASLKKL